MIIFFLIFTVVEAKAGQLQQYLILDNCATFTDTIIRVIDGDTLDGKNERIRLVGIDAPEDDEFGYHKAKDFLTKYEGKRVTIYYSKNYMYDKWKRLLGVITIGDEVLNIELLQSGLAKRCFFENDILRYEAWESAEISARKLKCGIWQYLASSGIFITEIHPNPRYTPEYEEYKAEFVELHNVNSNDVDIYGWKLEVVGKQLVIEEDIGKVIIEGGSFIVICGEAFSNLYSRPPKEVEILKGFNKDFNLPNEDRPPQGYTIYLYDAAGRIVDAMVYNLDWEGGNLNNTGYTLEKRNLAACNSGDSRLNGEDDNNWDTSLEKGGSPGYINTVSKSKIPPQIIAFPNPANINEDKYVTFLNTSRSVGIYSIRIYDICGKLVDVIEGNNSLRVSWPIAKLAVGLYLYVVRTMNDEIVTGKVALLK